MGGIVWCGWYCLGWVKLVSAGGISMVWVVLSGVGRISQCRWNKYGMSGVVWCGWCCLVWVELVSAGGISMV